MSIKVLNESCKFQCDMNPSILITAKDIRINKVQDSRRNVLTDTSRCIVNVPLMCPKLTVKSGGTTAIPCALIQMNWENTDSKVTINGHSILTSKSKVRCANGGVITPLLSVGVTYRASVVGIVSNTVINEASDTEVGRDTVLDHNTNDVQTHESDNRNADAVKKNDTIEQDNKETEPETDNAPFASYCRCDYADCKDRENCDYYKSQIYVENNSGKLSDNFKKERAGEWSKYLSKHTDKISHSSDGGGWRIAAHHMISGNQVLMMKDSNGNLIYGDIVKLANFFGYDVNNALNCIMLPTNRSNFGQDEAIIKIANAYEVMFLMGRQWHVGGHEYTLSEDTLSKLIEYYERNPEQYPSPGNPHFFNNYKTAVKEEMDKLLMGIRDQCWKKNYEHKRAKFIADINRVSKIIEDRLVAFEANPRKSFPFFVSKVSVEYAYNIPSTSKVIVIYRNGTELCACKYRIERYMKNDLEIFFNEKGSCPADNGETFVKFCENVMYFFVENGADFCFPFTSDEYDPYVVRSIPAVTGDINSYLKEHANEFLAFIQQKPIQYIPAHGVVSHRLEKAV